MVHKGQPNPDKQPYGPDTEPNGTNKKGKGREKIMQTWNDFFSSKPVRKHTQKTACRTYDDFEHDYMKKYGIWLDHDILNTIKQYGSEKGISIIDKKVKALNYEIKLAETENESAFLPIPDGVAIPF